MSPFHFCLSAAKNLSSFQLLSASLITELLQLFLGLPLFLFPWGFQSRAAFGISPSSFLNVWPIHLIFLFLIFKFISSCPVTFHRSLLEIIFGHHILYIYLRHVFTKVCILRWISFVTSQVSYPYKNTDFTHLEEKVPDNHWLENWLGPKAGMQNLEKAEIFWPLPVAARSKAWVCGRSPAEIVGSNPTGGMDVLLLWVSCVVR